MGSRNERGFSLVELLIGVAISCIIFFVLVALLQQLVTAGRSIESKTQAHDAVALAADRLDAETASAWAVYVPPSDLAGQSNSDGHEVDFYSEDGAHRSYAWAYVFDSSAKSLTRYSVGANATPSQTDVFSPIATFAAQAIPASQIGAVDPLFANSTIGDVAYQLPAMPSATGGNALVHLTLSGDGVIRDELLASATAPTTFTVVVGYTPSPAPLPTPTLTPLPLVTPTP